jgi:magnesium-dependent phosphatase 1
MCLYTLMTFSFVTVAPLERDGDKLNEVHDRYVTLGFSEQRFTLSVRFGEKVSLYHDVPQVLHRLRTANVVIAACSRTTATAL